MRTSAQRRIDELLQQLQNEGELGGRGSEGALVTRWVLYAEVTDPDGEEWWFMDNHNESVLERWKMAHIAAELANRHLGSNTEQGDS